MNTRRMITLSRSAALLAVASLTASLAAPLRAQDVVETVHLVITGGVNAGAYDAQGLRAGCSAGAEGPNTWGNQLSSSQGDPKAFNSLQLSVPDAKGAAAGTSHFLLMVGFGPLMKRTATYTVETRTNQKVTGKGTVTVKDAGATATVTFTAETADGVKLTGTIDCKKVMRIGS
jgi:hypothetical protein